MCVERKYNYHQKHCEIKALYDKIDREHEELLQVLETFQNGVDTPINKKDLEKFPLLEWVDLNDKVSIRKRKKLFGSYLNFDTKLKKDGAFGEHFHGDIIENAEVIKGKMLDKLNGEVYKEHDIMHYEKGEKHQPIALEETLLKVIFKP